MSLNIKCVTSRPKEGQFVEIWTWEGELFSSTFSWKKDGMLYEFDWDLADFRMAGPHLPDDIEVTWIVLDE